MNRVVLVSFAASASALLLQKYRSTRCMSMNSQLSQDELKKLVGYKAVDDYVRSNMIVGLGTGSTAYYAVERVGQKLKSGELTNIICIPTSERTKEQALTLGIPLVTLNEKSRLDVAIGNHQKLSPILYRNAYSCI